MAAKMGRRITVEWGGVEVPGCREKSIQISGAPIDVSSGEDNGWRTLLDEPGQRDVTISVNGVTKSNALREDWFAGTTTKTLKITYADGATLEGTFYLASYTDTGPYNDASTFDSEFQNSGAVTYTPAA